MVKTEGIDARPLWRTNLETTDTGAQLDDHLNGKVHARELDEFGGLRLALNVVCEVSPHEGGSGEFTVMGTQQ